VTPVKQGWVKRAPLIVSGLALAAWALLLAGLAGQSMWTDEWLTVKAIEPGWTQLLPSLIVNERRPPLYWLLFKLWRGAAGPSEFGLRLSAVAVTVLLVPVSYRLARRIGGPAAGLLTAGLIAFSPFVVLYGRMIRSYMLFTLLAVASTWALLRLMQRPTLVRWLLYAVLTTAMLYTDYVGLAVWAAHGLWLLVEARQRRAWKPLRWPLAAVGASGIAFLPWLGALLSQTASSGRSTPADLAGGVLGLAVKVVYPFVVFSAGQTLYPWNPLALAAIVLSGLLALAGLFALFRHQASIAWLVLGWVGGSLILTLLILTMVAEDITFLNMPSRAPDIAPAFSLLIALGALRIRSRLWRAAALGLIGAAFVLGLSNYYQGREFHNAIYAVPVRAAAARVRDLSHAGELVLAEDDTVFGYYYQMDPGLAAYRDATIGGEPPEVMIAARSPSRLWLVAYGRDHSLGALQTPEFEAWLAAHYRPLEQAGYGETSPQYRAVKELLLHRPAYVYKLTVTLYEPLP
jgi:mannosyltransferase